MNDVRPDGLFHPALYRRRESELSTDYHLIDTCAIGPAIRGHFGFAICAREHTKPIKRFYSQETRSDVIAGWQEDTDMLIDAVLEGRVLMLSALRGEIAKQFFLNSGSDRLSRVVHKRCRVLLYAQDQPVTPLTHRLVAACKDFNECSGRERKTSYADRLQFAKAFEFAYAYTEGIVHVYSRDNDVHDLFNNSHRVLRRMRNFDPGDTLTRLVVHEDLNATSHVIPYDKPPSHEENEFKPMKDVDRVAV